MLTLPLVLSDEDFLGDVRDSRMSFNNYPRASSAAVCYSDDLVCAACLVALKTYV
jgi:hypothetical protein